MKQPFFSAISNFHYALAAVLFAACSFPTASSALTLIKKSRSGYTIVVPPDAIPSERYAAEELQAYLEKISGARLPISSEPKAGGSRQILIGKHADAKGNIPWDKLGQDGFVLKTDGRRLIIAGGRPRGTLNGVYTFLEEQLGVRWFTPELERMPATNGVVLGSLNQVRVPALEYREVYWTEMTRNADFAARHHLNGDHYGLQPKHGGPFAIYFPFVHSFDSLVPRDLFKEHPEYFPLIDGKRADGYVQRCLSNPEVLKIAKARVRLWIKEHPNANIVSVSQNDTFNNCRCAECKAIDDAEGTPCGSLLRFVNAVAEDIEKDYPNVRIDTLAYQYTRKAPKTIRPRKNVIIRLCSIECCFAHPLETCSSEANRRFRDDIVAWGPIAPLLYVWDYTPNFANYQQPFPNFDVLQPNVQFFVDHNVKGLFEQGNYSSGGFGEMGPLRAYLLAELLWNPRTDVQKHKGEFCDAYYGPAAPKILEYLELMENQVRGEKAHAHIFDSPKSAYLKKAFLDDANRILDQAEAAAGDGPGRGRVLVARLPVWYVQLVTEKVTGDERTALLQKFLAVARGVGISSISEGQSLEEWAKKMEGK